MTWLCTVWVHYRFYVWYVCVDVNNTIAWAFELPVYWSWSPSRCTTTRLCEAPIHHRFNVRHVCVEVNISVAWAIEPSFQRSWPPSPCSMIRLGWSFSQCWVTKQFDGDTLLIPAASDELQQCWTPMASGIWWRHWENYQRRLHPMVTELQMYFTNCAV
jgi:hypothetical protein